MPRCKNFKKDQILLYQGEVTNTVYKINKGVIKASVVLSNGNEVNIGLFGPGDYFPVGVAFSQTLVAMFDYVVLTDSELEIHSPESFIDSLRDNPNATSDASKRHVSTMMHISALMQLTAYEKLLHTFRYLTARFGTKTNKIFTKIDIKLTQQDIAQLANLSRETTSIELKKLKTKSIVVERGKYYSVNNSLLNKSVGDENLESIRLQS